MARKTAFLILLCVCALRLGAEKARVEYHSEASIDWSGGEFLLDIWVESPDRLTPHTRYTIEQTVQEDLPGIFMNAVQSIGVDSRFDVKDAIRRDLRMLDRLKLLVPRGIKRAAHYVRGMGSVYIRYAFPLYGEQGLVASFVSHRQPYPLRRILGFVPVGNFTGIVIYAKGAYPLYGKEQNGNLEQCLFPRIYDENMEIVLEKERCDPQSLIERGMVAYTSDLDLRPFSARIGPYPVYVSARGIFGVNNRDILIPKESAERLLASPVTRRLLTQGRVLIIMDSIED